MDLQEKIKAAVEALKSTPADKVSIEGQNVFEFFNSLTPNVKASMIHDLEQAGLDKLSKQMTALAKMKNLSEMIGGVSTTTKL